MVFLSKFFLFPLFLEKDEVVASTTASRSPHFSRERSLAYHRDFLRNYFVAASACSLAFRLALRDCEYHTRITAVRPPTLAMTISNTPQSGKTKGLLPGQAAIASEIFPNSNRHTKIAKEMRNMSFFCVIISVLLILLIIFKVSRICGCINN